MSIQWQYLHMSYFKIVCMHKSLIDGLMEFSAPCKFTKNL